jgi:hypothetical protein
VGIDVRVLDPGERTEHPATAVPRTLSDLAAESDPKSAAPPRPRTLSDLAAESAPKPAAPARPRTLSDLVKERVDNPAQGDLFAAPITPSPDVMGLGATSPPCGAAPPPTALVLDLAALRQYAAQIAAWRPDLDGATAQRKATEWTTAAGAKRIGQLFEKVAPRKRSGAAKFAWVEERVANPRPLRQGRRPARGSRS